MRILRVIVVAALVLVVGVVLLRALDRPGAKLYVGGSIVTMDPQNRVVEALAVDGDRIVSTGSRAELRAWAEDAGAEVLDLEGRTPTAGEARSYIASDDPNKQAELVDRLMSSPLTRATPPPSSTGC